LFEKEKADEKGLEIRRMGRTKKVPAAPRGKLTLKREGGRKKKNPNSTSDVKEVKPSFEGSRQGGDAAEKKKRHVVVQTLPWERRPTGGKGRAAEELVGQTPHRTEEKGKALFQKKKGNQGGGAKAGPTINRGWKLAPGVFKKRRRDVIRSQKKKRGGCEECVEREGA